MSAAAAVTGRLALAFTLALALAACGSASEVTAREATAAQDAPSTATRAASLVLRWTIIVTERFETSRAFKSDTTDELFDQFMSVGAVQAVKDNASADKLREADATVDRFARTAIQNGTRLPDGSIEVTDPAVTAAVKATCPVYPFC